MKREGGGVRREGRGVRVRCRCEEGMWRGRWRCEEEKV